MPGRVARTDRVRALSHGTAEETPFHPLHPLGERAWPCYGAPMFASLHRADAELTPENGRARFVLTDHRDAGEMADVRELSIVFALVRILRTQRIATPTPAVFYYLPGLPPNFLVEAAASAGAPPSNGISRI